MRTLVDLVLPAWCAGCEAPGGVLCAACEGTLRAPARVAWPSPSPPGLPPPYAVAAYRDPVRRVLLARKERGVTALTAPLSAALARSADTAAPAGPLALVPVPSSPAARRARGEHVVAVLARAAARRLRRAGRDVAVVPALAHARRVADSAELSAADRARNLAGALRARPHASAATAGRLVVVVDDLVTTGATLAECARALAAAGVATHAAAVVAATQRRG